MIKAMGITDDIREDATEITVPGVIIINLNIFTVHNIQTHDHHH